MNALGLLVWALPPQDLSEYVLHIGRTYFDPRQPVVVQTPDSWYKRFRLETPLVGAEALFAQHFAQVTVGPDQWLRNAVKPGAYVFFVPRPTRATIALVVHMFQRIMDDAKNPAAPVVVALIDAFDDEVLQMAPLHYCVLHAGFSRIVFVAATRTRRTTFAALSFPLSGQSDLCAFRISHVDTVAAEGLFGQKPLNLQRCALDVHVSLVFPFFYIYESDYVGSGLEALGVFCRLHNCSLSFHETIRNAVHASFPVVFGGGGRMSYPHFRAEALWIVPSGAELPRWQCIFKVFGPLMSGLVLATAATAALTLWLLRRSGGVGGQSAVLLSVLLTHLAAGDGGSPKGPVAGAFLGLWLFYCLLINAAYQAGLFPLLVYPGREAPIATLDQLRHSGLQLKRLGGFLGLEPSAAMDILNYDSCADYDVPRCFRDVAESRTSAILAEGVWGTTYAGRYVDRFGHKKAEVLPQPFATAHLSFYFAELLHVLQEPMDRLLGRLSAAGILGKWERDQIRVLQSAYSRGVPRSETVFAFDLRHLQGPFSLLLLGTASACLLFVAEKLRHRWVRSN
ncbi:Ionotropic receptor 402 [Blattella germanica]|nr:Ionotropic receptor 402 [Blattella germanica]